MKTNRIIFLLVFSLLFFTCKQQKKKDEKVKYAPLMDITSYTGNAVAFFKDGLQYNPHRFSVQIIPISEKDSNVFKQDNFGIYEAIKNKPSYFFNIDYKIYDLYASNQKRKLERKICNIDNLIDTYIKVWVSYQNYEDISKARGEKIITDSCSVREIYIGHNGKLNEFKVLSNPKVTLQR